MCFAWLNGCSVFREALRAYPTSINEDLSLLREVVTGSREELAVQVSLCVLHRSCLLYQNTAAAACANCSLTQVFSSTFANAVWQHRLDLRSQPRLMLTVIVQARLGEKETLDVTLRYFEDRKSKLDRLEYYQERRLKGLGLLDDDGNNTWDDFFKDSIA